MTTNSKKDILDPSALLSLLPTLLPQDNNKLASPQDAIASLVHTIFCAVAFRLISVDDAGSLDPSGGNVLPKEWNKNGPGSYTFRYRHNESSLEFIVKVSKLGGRTVINAIAVETDKVASLDCSTDDFTSPSFFPHSMLGSGGEPLIHGFISSNRVADFTSQLKIKVLQKLMPGLRKEGYTDEVEPEISTTASSSSGTQPTRTPGPSHPQVVPPPDAPEFERFPRSHIPPENPLEIGRRDLDPIPMNPFAPPPMFPGGGGDGMFVGPDHPIFGNRRPPRDPFGNLGPWGGDGFLPPMGAPPGARFDPVGPGPFQPRRGGPQGGFPGGGNVRGPDNDEFMPPGMHDSMFS